MSHLFLYDAQIGQHNAKTHGDNENQNAGNRLAKAPKQYCIEGGEVRPRPCHVEVHVIKVPAGQSQHHSEMLKPVQQSCKGYRLHDDEKACSSAVVEATEPHADMQGRVMELNSQIFAH